MTRKLFTHICVFVVLIFVTAMASTSTSTVMTETYNVYKMDDVLGKVYGTFTATHDNNEMKTTGELTTQGKTYTGEVKYNSNISNYVFEGKEKGGDQEVTLYMKTKPPLMLLIPMGLQPNDWDYLMGRK